MSDLHVRAQEVGHVFVAKSGRPILCGAAIIGLQQRVCASRQEGSCIL